MFLRDKYKSLDVLDVCFKCHIDKTKSKDKPSAGTLTEAVQSRLFRSLRQNWLNLGVGEQSGQHGETPTLKTPAEINLNESLSFHKRRKIRDYWLVSKGLPVLPNRATSSRSRRLISASDFTFRTSWRQRPGGEGSLFVLDSHFSKPSFHGALREHMEFQGPVRGSGLWIYSWFKQRGQEVMCQHYMKRQAFVESSGSYM